MTLENMKEIAKENNGIIPAGIAMNMTDFEISKAIKAGLLKEAPAKIDETKVKRVSGKKAASGGKAQQEKKSQAKTGKDETPAKESPVMNPPAVEFCKEQKDRYSFLDGIIYDRMNDMQKSSFDIAYSLYMIYSNAYYKIDGYKNIYDYARERYGISRGTTNNFINITERFADLEKHAFELKPDYSGFSSTQLICMLGHTDDELKDKGIAPGMSSRDIKKALKNNGSKGEVINVVNGGKSDLDSDGKKSTDDSGEESADNGLNEIKANVVLELDKDSFSGFPKWGTEDSESEICLLDIFSKKAKVITKLLLLGHRIQILDIV